MSEEDYIIVDKYGDLEEYKNIIMYPSNYIKGKEMVSESIKKLKKISEDYIDISEELQLNENIEDCGVILTDYIKKSKKGLIKLYFPDGIYNFKSQLSITRSNVHIQGSENTIFNFEGYKKKGNHYRFSYINVKGDEIGNQLGRLIKLDDIEYSIDVIQGYEKEYNKDNKKVNMIEIMETDEIDGEVWDTHYPHQQSEIFPIDIEKKEEIKKVLKERLVYGYKRPVVRLYNFCENVNIEDIKIHGEECGYKIGICYKYVKKSIIRGNVLKNCNKMSIMIYSNYKLDIINNYITINREYSEKNKSIITYGINFMNASKMCSAIGNYIKNGRHGILTGHIANKYDKKGNIRVYSSGIQRLIYIKNNIIEGTLNSAITSHPASDKIYVEENKIVGCDKAINLRADNSVFKENIIIDCRIIFYFTIFIKDTRFINNSFNKCENYIYISPNNKTKQKHETYKNIEIKNNKGTKVSNKLIILMGDMDDSFLNFDIEDNIKEVEKLYGLINYKEKEKKLKGNIKIKLNRIEEIKSNGENNLTKFLEK